MRVLDPSVLVTVIPLVVPAVNGSFLEGKKKQNGDS